MKPLCKGCDKFTELFLNYLTAALSMNRIDSFQIGLG